MTNNVQTLYIKNNEKNTNDTFALMKEQAQDSNSESTSIPDSEPAKPKKTAKKSSKKSVNKSQKKLQRSYFCEENDLVLLKELSAYYHKNSTNIISDLIKFAHSSLIKDSKTQNKLSPQMQVAIQHEMDYFRNNFKTEMEEYFKNEMKSYDKSFFDMNVLIAEIREKLNMD